MKKLTYASTLILILFVAASFTFQPEPAISDDKITWLTFQEAVELNKKNPKKIFIDVYTDWCGWCKVMDSKTFTNPTVIKNMNKYFYAVKLNAEMKDTIVFNNHTFVNPDAGAARSTHQLAASLMNNQLSYPTTVYLDEKFNMLTPVPGYLKPEQIEPILIYFGEDKHKNSNYEEFVKTFKSELGQ